jgi:protocatechuate 3,4-dioxygenase beta subunit
MVPIDRAAVRDEPRRGASRGLLLAAVLAALVASFFVFAGRASTVDSPAGRTGAAADGDGAAERGDDVRVGARAAADDRSPIRTATLGGSVRGSDGQPIAKAEVCAWSDTTTSPQCAKTGVDGRYQIAAVPRSVIMSASANGFEPSHRPTGHEHGRVLTHGGADRSGLDFVLEPGGVGLAGVVSDVFGGPIEGAVVTMMLDVENRGVDITHPRALPLRATSDADGRFAIPTRRGGWLLTARAPGYADVRTSTVTPGPTVAIAMMPEASIAGVVVEAGADRPVPGARVTLRTWLDGTPIDRDVGHADDDGHFRIGGLSPGRHRPGATHGTMFGTADRSFAIDLAESIEGVRIEMTAGATLAGRVLVSPSDEPCTGGHVGLVDAASDERRIEPIASDGAVEVEGLLPGRYEVTVSCDDHSSAKTSRSVEIGTGANEITWYVEAGYTVHGKLLDGEGVGRRGYVSSFAAAGNGDGLVHTAEADDDGAFSIAGMAEGPHSLAGSLDDGARVSKTIDVGAALGEVELQLPPSAKLAGTVTRAAKPVANVRVEARLTRVTGPAFAGLGVARTDDDGHYVFADLRPGHYEVTIVDETEAALAKSDVELRAEGEALDFALPETADIDGVVLDAQGKPVPDATVNAIDATTLSSVDERADALRGAVRRTPVVTDAQGAFTIPDVDPRAKFTVLAQRRGGGQAVADGVVPQRRVVLRMSGLGDVEGTVESATPITALSVALHRVDGYSALRESFAMGNGSFTFTRVPPGTYDVVAIARQGRARGRVEVGATRTAKVGLVLEPNRKLHGRFVDVRTGAPLQGVYAVVTDEDGEVGDLAAKAERLIATRPDGVLSDAEGRFTLHDVPARTARLLAFGADFGQGLPDILEFVVIPAGAETTEVIDVPLVRRDDAAIVGDAFGLKLEVPMFCVDTPRIGDVDIDGLRAGDEIVAIDGHDTTGHRCYLARGLLWTTVGTRVELTLARGEVIGLVAREPA